MMLNSSNGSKPKGMVAFKYELLLLLMSLIWGSTFVVQQIGMEKGLGPMTFNGFRFGIGCLALIPFILWRRKKIPVAEQKVKMPYKACLGAGLLLFVGAALQQISLQYTSSANCGFITGFYILFVPLLGLFIGHKVRKSLWMGMLVCLIGFYFMSVTGNFVVSKGDWLALICAVFWACQILVIDHVAGKGDPIWIAFLQFAICAILSILSALIFENCSLVSIKAAFWTVIYAGLISVAIASTLQVICQKHCPPAPAAIIMSLEGVFAAITGYLVLNQMLTVRAIIGCFLILIGVLIVQLVPMMKKETK